MRNEKEENCAQVVEVIDLDDVEVAFPTKKRSRTERYTTTSTVITKSTNSSPDGCHMQQRSKIAAAEHPATAVVITKITEEANKMLKDTALSL